MRKRDVVRLTDSERDERRGVVTKLKGAGPNSFEGRRQRAELGRSVGGWPDGGLKKPSTGWNARNRPWRSC